MNLHSAGLHSGTRLVPGGGNVLLLSMRRLADLVAYCMLYEFEDVIVETTGADRVEADDQEALELSRRVYKLMRLGLRSRRVSRALAPPPSTVRLQRDYDLFLPIFNHTHELYALATIPDWRKHCRYAACYVSELWLHLLPHYLLEQLSDFDHIFLGVHHCVDEVAKITGRPCSYLGLATDVLRFSPAPQFPARYIDVCNIGRRSAVTHAALMRVARERKMFYSYDTVAASGFDQRQRTFRVNDSAEHRLLLAATLQRSRYYFAHRARVNEPEYTRGRDEMSGRFYEGAAAGTVMIGEPPRLDAFLREFDWTDALIPVPFDAPDIAEILARLDADPKRLERISRVNSVQAVLRHDWLYRLRTVFDTFGLTPTPGMAARQQALRDLAGVLMADSPLPLARPPPAPAAAGQPQLPLVLGSAIARAPLFSIIIPTHNRAGLVNQALQSVAAQTFADYEVIVVDDGSSDATSRFLQSVLPRPARIIRNEQSLGVSAARNRGAAVARGQFITFLDDDDELRPSALDALHRRFVATPDLDFLWGGRQIHEMDGTDRSIGTREDDWSHVPERLRGSNFLKMALQIATNSAFTIRRQVFEALGGFDEGLRVSEDRDLFIALSRQGYVGAAVSQSIVDVHERYSSLSRGKGVRGGAEIDLRVIEKHRDYLHLPEHREFLDSYLVTVFIGFLEAGDHRAAMRILGQLRRRRALNMSVVRKYLRHAPEFRALKALFRYDTIRRFRNALKQSSDE